MSTLLHLFKESVEFNIRELLPKLDVKPVTASAFTQSRYKIKTEFFTTLVDKVTACYQRNSKKLWHGYRLIGVDGSTLNLPPSKDILKNFKLYAQGETGIKRCLGRTLFFYDLLNDFILHGALSQMAEGEKTLLLKGLPQIQSNARDIFVLDRGFGHFSTIREFSEQKKLFCIRLSTETIFAKSILKCPGSDIITDWKPSEKERQSCRKNGLTVDSISIRIIKKQLANGETELLATNLLDQTRFTSLHIDELYQLRWNIEEGIKKLKPKMKIEQFGCKKTDGIYQEFYAHVFCYNMISLAGNMANMLISEQTQGCKKTYKYNWQNAFRFFREKIHRLLLYCKDWEHILDELIENIAGSCIAISPGRSFARDVRNRHRQRRINPYHK